MNSKTSDQRSFLKDIDIRVSLSNPSLSYIPWQEKYLLNIPEEYLELFQLAHQYLKIRTSDVHTSISVGFTKKLLPYYRKEKLNTNVVMIALILHDIGWYSLSEEEVQICFSIRGLDLNKDAIVPKEKHAVKGVECARKILNGSSLKQRLTEEDLQLIYDIILYHDKPAEILNLGHEAMLVADLDHLWSFSYEGFWLDTVRKDIDPMEYLDNLRKDMPDHFVTAPAKTLASQLIDDRRKEVVNKVEEL